MRTPQVLAAGALLLVRLFAQSLRCSGQVERSEFWRVRSSGPRKKPRYQRVCQGLRHSTLYRMLKALPRIRAPCKVAERCCPWDVDPTSEYRAQLERPRHRNRQLVKPM